MSQRFVRSALLFVSVLGVASLVVARSGAEASPGDALAKLEGRLERGETRLEYRDGAGYLPSCAALSPADRRAVLEILRDTKPQLPDFLKM
jgi:hypothetical protein